MKRLFLDTSNKYLYIAVMDNYQILFSHVQEGNNNHSETLVGVLENIFKENNLSIDDSIKLSKLSHSISNFERIGDYGVNILKIKRRMHQNKVHFTPDANRDLEIMSKAVSEIIDKATEAFINDDVNLAAEIEPLEQVIDNLKEELRARHSKRLQDNECTIENGMLFFDIINSFERIADHCSNLAVCIIELSNRSYQTHTYLKGVKSHNNKGFMEMFEEYLLKYKVG